MNSRRHLLRRLGLGAMALPALAFGSKRSTQEVPQGGATVKRSGSLPPPTQARGGDYFPNVLVCSHSGEKFRLYDDLIRDKVVTLNFMSIGGHQYFPVTQHLACIADRLGERLGRDVYMLSITSDPDNDTPGRLMELAKQYGANRTGWYFLTSATDKVRTVSRRLRKHGELGLCGPSQNGFLGHPMRLVHYGNGGVGLWATFGVDCEPDLAVERLSWMHNGAGPRGPLRRAGPCRVGDNCQRGHNRVA